MRNQMKNLVFVVSVLALVLISSSTFAQSLGSKHAKALGKSETSVNLYESIMLEYNKPTTGVVGMREFRALVAQYCIDNNIPMEYYNGANNGKNNQAIVMYNVSVTSSIFSEATIKAVSDIEVFPITNVGKESSSFDFDLSDLALNATDTIEVIANGDASTSTRVPFTLDFSDAKGVTKGTVNTAVPSNVKEIEVLNENPMGVFDLIKDTKDADLEDGVPVDIVSNPTIYKTDTVQIVVEVEIPIKEHLCNCSKFTQPEEAYEYALMMKENAIKVRKTDSDLSEAYILCYRQSERFARNLYKDLKGQGVESNSKKSKKVK